MSRNRRGAARRLEARRAIQTERTTQTSRVPQFTWLDQMLAEPEARFSSSKAQSERPTLDELRNLSHYADTLREFIGAHRATKTLFAKPLYVSLDVRTTAGFYTAFGLDESVNNFELAVCTEDQHLRRTVMAKYLKQRSLGLLGDVSWQEVVEPRRDNYDGKQALYGCTFAVDDVDRARGVLRGEGYKVRERMQFGQELVTLTIKDAPYKAVSFTEDFDISTWAAQATMTGEAYQFYERPVGGRR